MSWTKEEKEVKSGIRRWGWWLVGTVIILSIVFSVFGRASGFLGKLTDPDRAITTYENFYQMHEQANQMCNDIYVMQNADSLSGGFSKNERIMGLENKMNDIIRDYNAQSKAWTKNMWKAGDLPHTLNRNDFNCK